MEFSLKVARPEALERDLLKALRDRLNLVFHQAAPAIRSRVSALATRLVEGTPEYASLARGDLLGELGIPDVDTRLRQILEAVGRGVFVSAVPVRVVGRRLEGGMVAGVYRDDFEDLLSLAAASYVSAPSGSRVDWLDWLLRQGDRVIVLGYDVDFDLTPGRAAKSRTGKALMVKGAGWRVPPEFAGTPESNFLLRAFDAAGVAAEVTSIFRDEILGRF